MKALKSLHVHREIRRQLDARSLASVGTVRYVTALKRHFFRRSVVFSTSATFGSRQEVVKNFSQQCSVSRQSTSITGLCHQSERPYQCGSEEASCERRAKDPEKHNSNCQPQIGGRGNNKPKRSGIDDPSTPQSAARNAAERDSRKACWPRRVVAKRPWERMFNSRSFQQFQDQSVVGGRACAAIHDLLSNDFDRRRFDGRRRKYRAIAVVDRATPEPGRMGFSSPDLREAAII
ncbi:MAG: hypothetical protein WAU53_05545 [Rhodoplanes sp.]